MSNRFASTRNALGVCDICSFVYKRKELQNVIVKGRDTNIQACWECWDPDQPQLHLGERPIDDPQAIMNPRPQSPEYPESRSQIVPLYVVTATGWVGNVTVSTT